MDEPARARRRAVGLAAGAAFLAIESAGRHPLFDVRVLARPRVAAGALDILAAYIATFGDAVPLPQYVQYVQDGSALARASRSRRSASGSGSSGS